MPNQSSTPGTSAGVVKPGQRGGDWNGGEKEPKACFSMCQATRSHGDRLTCPTPTPHAWCI
eukprot:CAMPEP_0180270054 /NCGR_PEP_ID=MMETSP0988-20121125/2977_1 /TAXON_ID=697907 /ORGANISM="non described non described, Strain CCMP2293" /LENGTH=60 /DNA_ID=CAMNT_0022240973 /DNA_START=147 /DNA_END=329 /DNA_ORIENTATION=+